MMGAMPTWKAHSLAAPHADQIDLAKGDTVVATIDLPGVPAGTTGKIILANGFSWLRYRVLFDGGVELADLDGRQLAPGGKTAKRLAKAEAKAKK
jgi:hypothetical protein